MLPSRETQASRLPTTPHARPLLPLHYSQCAFPHLTLDNQCKLPSLLPGRRQQPHWPTAAALPCDILLLPSPAPQPQAGSRAERPWECGAHRGRLRGLRPDFCREEGLEGEARACHHPHPSPGRTSKSSPRDPC